MKQAPNRRVAKTASFSGLILATMLVVGIITGAPWWAFWTPLLIAFVASLFLLAGAYGDTMGNKPDNVVDLNSRRPRG